MSNQSAYYEAVKENNIELVKEYLLKEDVDPQKDNSFIFSAVNNNIDMLKLIINNSDVNINKHNSWLFKRLIKESAFEALNIILNLDNEYIIKFQEIHFVLKYAMKNNEILFLNIINETKNNIDFNILFEIVFRTNNTQYLNKISDIFFLSINKIDDEIKTNIIYLFIKYDELNLFKKLYSIMGNEKDNAYIREAVGDNSVEVFSFLNKEYYYKPFMVETLVSIAISENACDVLLLLIDNPKYYIATRDNSLIYDVSLRIDLKGYDKVFKKIIDNKIVNPLCKNSKCISSLIQHNRYDLLTLLLAHPYVSNFTNEEISSTIECKTNTVKLFNNFINVKDF